MREIAFGVCRPPLPSSYSDAAIVLKPIDYSDSASYKFDFSAPLDWFSDKTFNC
jgi:hypothetical protein